jgi:hypothetical protein
LFDEEPEGDIEHDPGAFERELVCLKRGVDQIGTLPGFAPAGIKGSDSDEVVVRKWQAYMHSPKFNHKGLPPKRVLMAMIRQDGGDRGLAADGLTPDLIGEFNHGHLTNRALLALMRGPEPHTPQERTTWPKLSLSKASRMEAEELHESKNGVLKRRTHVPVYLFDIENRPDECMLAAMANNLLYVPPSRSFKLRKWWMGVDFFGLEVGKRKKMVMVAEEVIEKSRQMAYELGQMRRLIQAYLTTQAQDAP